MFIELKEISYTYQDIPALRQMNLHVEKGECIVLEGPNGCGKTTLLKILNGLLFADRGTYIFDGQEINQGVMKNRQFAKQFHQRIGYVFQNADVQLFNGSVYDEVAFGPRQMQLSKEEVTKRTTDCLTLFDIMKLKDRAPYQLSGGEKKKVALAAVLSMNPEVIVFDEPLAGLDRASKIWLESFLKQLKTAGKTLIISTHDDRLAEELADRIVYMNEAHTVEAHVQ